MPGNENMRGRCSANSTDGDPVDHSPGHDRPRSTVAGDASAPKWTTPPPRNPQNREQFNPDPPPAGRPRRDPPAVPARPRADRRTHTRLLAARAARLVSGAARAAFVPLTAA